MTKLWIIIVIETAVIAIEMYKKYESIKRRKRKEKREQQNNKQGA